MFLEKPVEKEVILNNYKNKLLVQKSHFKQLLRLIDYATFTYIGVVAFLLIFFHRGVPYWRWLVMGHFLVIGFLIFFIKFAASHPSKILTFIRDGYPFILFTVMFTEVNAIDNILFPFWLEPWLIKLDYLLFRTYPTVWFQKFYNPLLTEIMAFSYWSYYVLIPFGGIVLYLRKDKALFHSFAFHLSLTLYIAYFSYIFMTARGPHETLVFLHSERAVAGFFDSFVQRIQNYASISGNAFPSSHVAAVWVVLIFLFKYNSKLGWIVLPIILLLSISIVYMRYHYAVDSIAGILLVCITYPLGRFLETKFLPSHPKSMFHSESM
jgi:membrane-associated phospholipid phosphatase